ncbi:MAG: phospholipase D-like domain-containing protein, partial [Nanoarchaeota archaeon]
MILAGCAPRITGEVTGGMPQETAKNPEVYFCPKEDCSKVFEAHIKSANFSAHCAFYDIDLKNMISSLAKKSKTADVKVVIDSSNYQEQIKGDGIRMDDDKQLMHNKFCVIDNSIVITGSFNPTDNDNNYNNNNVVVIYSNILAGNYGDEFNELWSGKFGKGNNVNNPLVYINNMKTENYFCPEDKCASHIINLIKNA